MQTLVYFVFLSLKGVALSLEKKKNKKAAQQMDQTSAGQPGRRGEGLFPELLFLVMNKDAQTAQSAAPAHSLTGKTKTEPSAKLFEESEAFSSPHCIRRRVERVLSCGDW